jgi:hypothetical protein
MAYNGDYEEIESRLLREIRRERAWGRRPEEIAYVDALRIVRNVLVHREHEAGFARDSEGLPQTAALVERRLRSAAIEAAS